MESVFIVLLIGAFGGVVRSLLGYKYQAEEGEKFSWEKFIKSVVRAAIGGAFIVYTTVWLTATEVNSQTYILAFFASVGADVITKELYGAASG
jgi:fluoride ion exporter CrcB/FEX